MRSRLLHGAAGRVGRRTAAAHGRRTAAAHGRCTAAACGRRTAAARGGLVGLALIAALTALTACADSGPRQDAAAGVALRLLTAVHNRDGASACAALAPDTAAEVAQSGGGSCPQAILDDDLPGPAGVRTVAIYGQWAQVTLADPGGAGTVFLAVLPGGWRVVAAGCKSRGERPYDCTVQGG
jgi:hypothetical protein